MAHPLQHAKSSVKKWGGVPEDYIQIHEMFRHHSEGIFECEEYFGKSFINSDGKTVYTRYVGEQHVKEDCNNYIPTAKEWLDNINKPTKWMIKTLKIED
jgi:hypothetical protein